MLTKPAYIISASDPPVAGFTIDPPLVCAGSEVQFINTSLNSSTYAWNFGDGTGASTIDASHTYDNNGDAIVQLIASNGCGSDTLELGITVLGTEAVALVESDPCELSVTVASISLNAATVQWLFGDGGGSTDSATTHAYLAAGSFDLLLITDPGSTCADTLITPVTVDSPPTAAFSSDLLCDQVVNFTDNSTPGSTLQWIFGDGTTGNQPFETHAYPGTGPYDMQLIATNTLGCADTAFIQVVPITTVTASFDPLAGPCEAAQSFANTSTGADTFLWMFGDGSSDSTTAPTHLYGTTGDLLVSLIASPGTACADTASAWITLADPPTAAFTDSTGCSLDVFLQDGSLNADALAWDLGDGTSSVLPQFSHAYDGPGSYTVELIASTIEGCADTASTTVTIAPQVLAAFTSTYDACDATWSFFNTSLNATQFMWDLGDGTETAEANPTHTYSGQGEVVVELFAIASDGCSDTVSASFNVADSGILPDLFIPNCFSPNGDGMNELFLIGGSPVCFDVRVRIYNRWGEVIFDDVDGIGWDGRVNGSEAPEGTYIYLLTGRKERRYGTVTLLR